MGSTLDFLVGLTYLPLETAAYVAGDSGGDAFKRVSLKLENFTGPKEEDVHRDDERMLYYQGKEAKINIAINDILSGNFQFEGKALDPTSAEGTIALAYLRLKQLKNELYEEGWSAKEYGRWCGLMFFQLGAIAGLSYAGMNKIYHLAANFRNYS